jgi:hypothetical protein
MSSNSLVAFCVAALFLLAAIVIVASFIERRRDPTPPVRPEVDTDTTASWTKLDEPRK